MRSFYCFGIALCTTLALGLVSAQPAPSPPKSAATIDQEPQHRGPPPEALAACKALANGASCAFTSPRGPEKGSCFAPEGRPLACRPAHRPQGPGAGAQSGAQPKAK